MFRRLTDGLVNGHDAVNPSALRDADRIRRKMMD
jgi:hypothetical protein